MRGQGDSVVYAHSSDCSVAHRHIRYLKLKTMRLSILRELMHATHAISCSFMIPFAIAYCYVVIRAMLVYVDISAYCAFDTSDPLHILNHSCKERKINTDELEGLT